MKIFTLNKIHKKDLKLKWEDKKKKEFTMRHKKQDKRNSLHGNNSDNTFLGQERSRGGLGSREQINTL